MKLFGREHSKGEKKCGNIVRRIVKIVSPVLFLVIFAVLFSCVQSVLSRDWSYPSSDEAPGDMMREYYELTDEMEFQAVFFGASGFEWDIDPMSIYKKTGIVTYNMASSGQPFPVSYYLCKEMLKTQRPKVVVMSAEGLFTDTVSLGAYHYIFDHMPMSKNKLEFASYFAEAYSQSKKQEAKKTDYFLGAILPLYQYHERWTSLSAADFKTRTPVNYMRKGYLPYSGITTTSLTIDEMNEMIGFDVNVNGWTVTYKDGVPKIAENSKLLYAPEINLDYWEMLLELREECGRNGAELILVRTPAYGNPFTNSGVWTKEKAEILREYAEKANIDVVDLQYDVDLEFDWTCEAGAGTQHLNYWGAQKISDYLGKVLQERYGLQGSMCPQYENDIEIYDKVVSVAKLQLSSNLYEYTRNLQEFDDISILCSASDDMQMGLSEKIGTVLHALGLQTDFSELGYCNSYLAVVENGEPVYEAYSNRTLSKSGTLSNRTKYSISSKGYYVGSGAVIKVDGVDYSLNGRGLNIVVVDNKTGLVLDSVRFDLHDANNASAAKHNGTFKEKAIQAYEDFIQKEDARVNSEMDKAAYEFNYAEREREFRLAGSEDIYNYLDILSELKNESYTILMAVRDIQGFALTKEITDKLAVLGIENTDVLLEWKYHSFAGAISDGQVIYQHIGIDDEPSTYIGEINGDNIDLVSMTLHGGNDGSIKINGIDYSINRRGINIVVINDKTGKVVDSVNFDTHELELACTRRPHS